MKILKLVLFLIALPVFVLAQTYEFPNDLIGFNKIPEVEKRQGIRSIIYTKQRGEYVFDTKAELFDASGRKIEELSQSASIEIHSGQLVRLGGKKIYVYDSRRKLGKIIGYDIEGTKSYTEIFNYDEKGLLTGTATYDWKGEKYNETKYTRNANNRNIEVVWILFTNKRAVNDNFTLSFNEKNQCIKRVEHDNVSVDTNLFEFNEKGYVSKLTKNGYGFIYAYKYDKKGNWIERQTAYFEEERDIKDEPHMSEYRVISYYEDEKKESSNSVLKTIKPKK